MIVADDVALAGSEGNAGRRGLAGTVLVHKIAGAAADAGATLADVAAAARSAAAAVRTMGVALTPCTVPAVGRPGFALAENEIELGLGIHGEPGVSRGPLEPADALVDRLLEAILKDFGASPVKRAVLMINNLGGTPTMELAIVARRALAVLEARGIAVERVYVGTFLSALEMAGMSLSVLPVDDATLAALDSPTDAPAWPNAVRARTRSAPADSPAPPPPAPTREAQTAIGRAIESGLLAAAAALRREAPRLTELDQAVGDGDLGISMERGAAAIEDERQTFPLDEPAAALHVLGLTLQRSLGGSSGPFYGVFFLRAARTLRAGRGDDLAAWAAAFEAGCDGIAELGGAAVGDRTMLDALVPASEVFSARIAAGRPALEALKAAAMAAADSAAKTAALTPRKGRSSYLGARAIGHVDPGAEAVAIWLAAIAAG